MSCLAYFVRSTQPIAPVDVCVGLKSKVAILLTGHGLFPLVTKSLDNRYLEAETLKNALTLSNVYS